jgi:MFS family permease
LQQRFFYGWVVLGVAALGIFASGPGQSHTIGIFFRAIGSDLGLSQTWLTMAYGGATLVAALCLPQMGKLLDRHGARRMLTIVSALLGLACLGFAGVPNVVLLAVGFGALRFLGQGSLMLNCANLVSQWFSRKRGFALSLMTLGFAASMAVHPPLVQWLIAEVGWRQAWVWLGVMTWVLLLPAVLLLVHNKPADMDLRPDGEAAPAPGQAPVDDLGLTLHQALRTPAFYIIATGLFSLSSLVTALHVLQGSIFVAHGLGQEIAARVFPISAVTMVIMMPVFGRMLDRFPTQYMFAGGLMIMCGSLLAITQVVSLPTAIAYAMVFGANNAVTMTFFSYMWPRYFGRQHLGSIQGTGQMIGVVGASLGPLPFGFYFDYFGNYNPMLFALALFPAACAVMALFLRVPAVPVPPHHT